jgi:large subunit ribosomal protein L1
MKLKASKRFKKFLEVSKDKKIEVIDEAIKKVKKNCTTKFDESIDVSFNLNIKQKKDEVTLRTSVNLPNGNGRKIKVAVLCEDSKIHEAKDAGADLCGSDSLVNDINAGKINFDKLVATPTMMPKMGKLGKILGPTGLMPNLPILGIIVGVATSLSKFIFPALISFTKLSDPHKSAPASLAS